MSRGVVVRNVPPEVSFHQQLFIWLVLLIHDKKMYPIPALSGVFSRRYAYSVLLYLGAVLTVLFGIFWDPGWFFGIAPVVLGACGPYKYVQDRRYDYFGKTVMGPPPIDTLRAAKPSHIYEASDLLPELDENDQLSGPVLPGPVLPGPPMHDPHLLVDRVRLIPDPSTCNLSLSVEAQGRARSPNCGSSFASLYISPTPSSYIIARPSVVTLRGMPASPEDIYSFHYPSYSKQSLPLNTITTTDRTLAQKLLWCMTDSERGGLVVKIEKPPD